MENTHAQRMLRTAKALRASLLVVITHVDDLCDLLETSTSTNTASLPIEVAVEGQALRIERGAYQVKWRGRQCSLGYTMAFLLIERLARRPNQYIQTDALIDELWSGPRAYSTVRSTVCRLKARLRSDGLGDLADMIDGSMPDHYGLILNGR